jgi:hypothetical protein
MRPCRILLLVVLLAVLAGPRRCSCGIRAPAADATSQGHNQGNNEGRCSCCEAPRGMGSGPADVAGHQVAACCMPGDEGERDDEGCPARGKPRQSWNAGGDGQAGKFRPDSGVVLVVSAVTPACRHLTAASGTAVRSPGERAARGGRDLLRLLHILRC